MSRKLEDLDDHFRPLAEQLIAGCVKAGVPVTIIDTLRTQAEQDRNVKNGTSWVKRSKHQDGLAIDLCPNSLLDKKGWAPDSQLWQVMARVGRELGLICGADWLVRDMGHYELDTTEKV